VRTNTSHRKERIDRGIKVRSDDIFVLASMRDLLYVILPKAIVILAMFILPLLKDVVGMYWLNVLVTTLVIILLALSWDLLASAGLVSLGQAFFFGVGSYIAGYLSFRFGWSPLFTIPTATLVGAIICALFLYPVLRLRGIYFGLITFALPLLFGRLIEATKVLGGTEGMSALPPLHGITGKLYLLMFVVLLTLFGFRRLISSNYGLVFQGIRDNDRAVIAAGYNIQWYKTQAVFIAALPATFAGAFVAHHFQFVGIPAFAMDYSILPLTAVVVGGAGTFIGGALGAVILMPLSEILREFGSLRVVIYSLLLLIFSIGLPEGLFKYIKRKYSQIERLTTMEEVKHD